MQKVKTQDVLMAAQAIEDQTPDTPWTGPDIYRHIFPDAETTATVESGITDIIQSLAAKDLITPFPDVWGGYLINRDKLTERMVYRCD